MLGVYLILSSSICLFGREDAGGGMYSWLEGRIWWNGNGVQLQIGRLTIAV